MQPTNNTIIYLIHFDEPYCHAKHYMGSTGHPGGKVISHSDAVLTKQSNRSLLGKDEGGLEPLAALQKIAGVEAIDLSGTRSWRELTGEAGTIARAAIMRMKEAASPVQDAELVVALEKIGGIETADHSGQQLSWKDRVNFAVKIAVETIEKVESRSLAKSVETTQTREPSLRDQGIGW